MNIMTFEEVCCEYGIHPQLVAEDLQESGVEDGLTEERLREWLENNY